MIYFKVLYWVVEVIWNWVVGICFELMVFREVYFDLFFEERLIDSVLFKFEFFVFDWYCY